MSDQHHVEEGETPGLPPMSGLMFSAAPAIAFLILNSVANLRVAIVGATIAAVTQSVMRRRSGQSIGKFWPIVNAGVILRGSICVIFDSEAVYFGIGIGTKAVIGLALGVSVLVNRPALGELLPYVLRFPKKVVADPIYRRTAGVLTLAAAGYYMLTSVWDIWLFQRSSTNEFVLIRLVVNWVLGIVAFGAAFAYLDTKLKKIDGFDGVLPLLEDMSDNMWGRNQ